MFKNSSCNNIIIAPHARLALSANRGPSSPPAHLLWSAVRKKQPISRAGASKATPTLNDHEWVRVRPPRASTNQDGPLWARGSSRRRRGVSSSDSCGFSAAPERWEKWGAPTPPAGQGLLSTDNFSLEPLFSTIAYYRSEVEKKQVQSKSLHFFYSAVKSQVKIDKAQESHKYEVMVLTSS